MDGMAEIVFYLILFTICVLLVLLASFIENMFFTLHINYLNYSQQTKIVNFLKRFHIKYTVNHRESEIQADKGLIYIIICIVRYIKLRSFFSDAQTIENAYFKIEYKTNNIVITNKFTNKSIVNMDYENEIWDLVIDNISEFFDEKQLIDMLKNFGYITDKQAVILLTDTTVKNDIIKVTKTLDNYPRNKRKVFDVNNCSLEQLSDLPFITLVIAKKLVKYRNDNNGFKSVSDFWLLS